MPPVSFVGRGFESAIYTVNVDASVKSVTGPISCKSNRKVFVFHVSRRTVTSNL